MTWVVVENDPGYLPDSDPAEFTSRRDAERYAADLARSARDDGWVVRGSARSGRYDMWLRDWAYAERVIEVTQVT